MPDLCFIRFLLTFLFLAGIVLPDANGDSLPVRDRLPVALTQTESGLIVANDRAGTLSVVSKLTGQVTSETEIGERIVDIQKISDRRFVALDRGRSELLVLVYSQDKFHQRKSVALPAAPVHALFIDNKELLSVTSLWARQVTLIRGVKLAAPEIERVIDLPFAPLLQVVTPDQKYLIVADAFGGKLAVIEVASGKLRALRWLKAHNIRGLTVSPDGSELMIAHQMMNQTVPTERSRVFWGTVMSNILRSVSFKNLLQFHSDDAKVYADAIHHWSLVPLGTSGNASGDPAQVAHTPFGDTVVALSGVDEVAIRNRPLDQFVRLPVQRRPTAVLIDANRRVAYIANTLAASVSVVDIRNRKVIRHISLGPGAESTSVSRGESLFHDARLALDGWFSCHSCHSRGHSNGLLNDNFGDDTVGAPKRVLTLRGVAGTAPWSWIGKQHVLHEQIAKSIELTMRGDPLKQPIAEQARDIASYLATLRPPPPLDVARGRVSAAAVERGRAVFNKHDCVQCHIPPRYTDRLSYDVGLKDETGATQFNPPSLLSVSQQDAYLHDNRAATLEDVFRVHRHPAGKQIIENELQDLLAFLRQL